MLYRDEVKAMLESYRSVQLRILQINDEIEKTREHYKMPSKGIDGMPRNHKIRDLSDFAIRLDELLEELRTQYDALLKKKRLVIQLVNELTNETELTVLWFRYLRFSGDAKLMSSAEIGEKIGYSDRQVERYLKSGLDHLVELWPQIKNKYV